MSEHLSNNTIIASDVEKIVQNITNTVADFHAAGLVTGDFDTSDIHVMAEGEVGFGVEKDFSRKLFSIRDCFKVYCDF